MTPRQDAASDEEPETVREWVEAYLRDVAPRNHSLPTDEDAVRVLVPHEESALGIDWYAPRSALPDWISVEDLPVRDGEKRELAEVFDVDPWEPGRSDAQEAFARIQNAARGGD